MKLLNLPIMFLTGFLATCGSPAPSQAQERGAPTTIGVHTFSMHSSKVDIVSLEKWNNINPGIYAKWDDGLVIGGYYNSLRKPSLYVGYSVALNASFDVVVGAITGYRGGDKLANGGKYPGYPIMPMLVPSFHFPIGEKIEGRVHYVPKISKFGAQAVHFSIESRF